MTMLGGNSAVFGDNDGSSGGPIVEIFPLFFMGTSSSRPLVNRDSPAAQGPGHHGDGPPLTT